MGTVSRTWRLGWALCATLYLSGTVQAQSQQVFNIALPEESLADALNGLSEQTGVPSFFPTIWSITGGHIRLWDATNCWKHWMCCSRAPGFQAVSRTKACSRFRLCDRAQTQEKPL